MATSIIPRLAEVREVQKGFTSWRKKKRGGEKNPLRLWQAAVKLCRMQG